jgi:hypothetical protein
MTNNKVTIRDVYDIVDRMETNVDRRLVAIQSSIADNSARITALEVWRANLAGKLAIITGVAVLGFNLIVEYVKEKFLKQ